MLQELGLNEIIFDPPRPIPPEMIEEAEDEDLEWEDGWDHLPDPPRIPKLPFSDEEARRRIGEAIAAFETPLEAIEELHWTGSSRWRTSR